MLCTLTYEYFHFEKSHVSFGHMLILSDDLVHGGCLGSHGSFRFHFTIKDLESRGCERLVCDNQELN